MDRRHFFFSVEPSYSRMLGKRRVGRPRRFRDPLSQKSLASRSFIVQNGPAWSQATPHASTLNWVRIGRCSRLLGDEALSRFSIAIRIGCSSPRTPYLGRLKLANQRVGDFTLMWIVSHDDELHLLVTQRMGGIDPGRLTSSTHCNARIALESCWSGSTKMTHVIYIQQAEVCHPNVSTVKDGMVYSNRPF
jgi:hypothetical protein